MKLVFEKETFPYYKRENTGFENDGSFPQKLGLGIQVLWLCGLYLYKKIKYGHLSLSVEYTPI